MDFLKATAFSQSIEHLHLLLFILNIVYFLFLSYLGFFFGASVVSWYFSRKGRISEKQVYNTFARSIVEIPLANKSVVLFLGIIPALAVVLISAQLFQSTPVISVSLLTVSFLLLVAAAVLLYAYKYTFALGGILESVEPFGKQQKSAGLHLDEYRASTSHTRLQSARYGIIVLTLAVFFFFAALAVMTDPLNWAAVDSLLSLLLVPDVYVRFVHFLALSSAVTGIGILYFLSGKNKKTEPNDEQQALVRMTGLRMTTAGLLLQPLMIIANIILLPPAAYSGGFFLVSALGIVSMFFAAQFIFAYMKEGYSRYLSTAFSAVMIAVLFLVIRDQIAIRNVTKEHAARLNALYLKENENIKASLGIAIIKTTGEDIYNGRCSACHLFDAKKIGPPYYTVLPKYQNQKEKLASFILNPSKIDPAYPSMPNQGLKPAEADSIASFLLRKLEEKTGKK